MNEYFNIDDKLNKKMLKTIHEIREKQIDDTFKHVSITENETSAFKKFTQDQENIPPYISYSDFHNLLELIKSNIPITSHFFNYRRILRPLLKSKLEEREEKIDKYFNDNFIFNSLFKDQNTFKQEIKNYVKKLPYWISIDKFLEIFNKIEKVPINFNKDNKSNKLEILTKEINKLIEQGIGTNQDLNGNIILSNDYFNSLFENNNSNPLDSNVQSKSNPFKENYEKSTLKNFENMNINKNENKGQVQKYEKGQKVLYIKDRENTNDNNDLLAEIIQVHHDDFPNIYYTIKLINSGKEIQTISKNLAPYNNNNNNNQKEKQYNENKGVVKKYEKGQKVLYIKDREE